MNDSNLDMKILGNTMQLVRAIKTTVDYENVEAKLETMDSSFAFSKTVVPHCPHFANKEKFEHNGESLVNGNN